MRRSKDKVLRPVHANAGIRAAYRGKLDCLIEEMARSYAYWLRAAYRADPPEMAQDASPAVELDRAVRALGRYWQRRFNEAAPKLARYFAKSASRRSDAALRKILRDAGISVEFRMTAAMNDILQATIAENVGLIKSIASEYHTQVQGMVMRSVTAGRDLETLSKDLQKRFGITKRRAEFIALDQNNKATAALQRVRQVELGITKVIWLHSHAGKVPRPTHLANNGKPYDPAVGWFDPDPKVRRHIVPGELINCRCVAKPVIRGFS